MTCGKNYQLLSKAESRDLSFRLTIYMDGDVASHIDGFNSIEEAMEHGVEWRRRLWCSVWIDGVEVATEYPRKSLRSSGPECTAYRHVIPMAGN